jgi:hypothetical protein
MNKINRLSENAMQKAIAKRPAVFINGWSLENTKNLLRKKATTRAIA